MEANEDGFYQNTPNKPFVTLAAIGSLILGIFSVFYFLLTQRAELAAIGISGGIHTGHKAKLQS
jgi:hypothetical protein